MLAGQASVTDHGVAVHLHQPSGGSNAVAFGEVLEDRDGLLLGQLRAEQGCSLAFGETVLAGAAVKHPALFVLAVAGADGQVAETAFAVIGALLVHAAETRQVLGHHVEASRSIRRQGLAQVDSVIHTKDLSRSATLRHHPIFSPEENEFLDAYYDEIRSLTIGPCLTAVDGLEIPHGEINHLVGYRATELLHEGQAWPQPHPSSPPIPWASLDDFKRRFFPPRPEFPWHDYVPLDREAFSAKEHAYLAHYLHEITTLTPGPAHEYLRSQFLSPIVMIPFLKHTFSYVRFDSSGKFLNPACKFLTESLPAFEIPWGTRSIFLGRVLRFCRDESMKTLVEPFLPSEESAYVYKPIAYRFFLSQEEEGFIRWYLAETLDATGGLMPATQWLWANGVYPSTLEAFLHVYRRPDDHYYDCEHDNPLPPFRAPWLAKEDFEARLKGALEAFPELKDNPSALPGYLPEGYEVSRLAWLRSIPTPPALLPLPTLNDS